MSSLPHLTIVVATLTRGRPQMLRALIESWGAMDVPPACDLSCLVVENALRPLSLPVVQAARPLPNGLRVDHLLENLGADTVVLGAGHMARLERLFGPGAVSGDRYGEQARTEVDTEQG